MSGLPTQGHISQGKPSTGRYGLIVGPSSYRNLQEVFERKDLRVDPRKLGLKGHEPKLLVQIGEDGYQAEAAFGAIASRFDSFDRFIDLMSPPAFAGLRENMPLPAREGRP
jgi:hypothetical protein